MEIEDMLLANIRNQEKALQKLNDYIGQTRKKLEIFKMRREKHKDMINLMVRLIGKAQPFFFMQPRKVFEIPEDVFYEIMTYLPASILFLNFGLTCRYFFILASTRGVLHLSSNVIHIDRAPSYVLGLKIMSIKQNEEVRHTMRKNSRDCVVKKVVQLIEQDRLRDLEYLHVHCNFSIWPTFYTSKFYSVNATKLPKLKVLKWRTSHKLLNFESLTHLRKLTVHVKCMNDFETLTKVIQNNNLIKLKIIDDGYYSYPSGSLNDPNVRIIGTLCNTIIKCSSLKKIIIKFRGQSSNWRYYKSLFQSCKVPIEIFIRVVNQDFASVLEKTSNCTKLVTNTISNHVTTKQLASIKALEIRSSFISRQILNIEELVLNLDYSTSWELHSLYENQEKQPSLRRLYLSSVTGKNLLIHFINILKECTTIEEVIVNRIENLKADKTGRNYMKSLKMLIQDCNHIKIFKVNIPRPDGCSIDALLNELNYNTNLEIFEPWILSDEEVNLIKLNKGIKKRKRSERLKNRKKQCTKKLVHENEVFE